jgi:fatty acid desaturase
MNLTLHVEHHDFPRVPWVHLPKIRRIAPSFYNSLRLSPGLATSVCNHYFGQRREGTSLIPHYACT